MTSLKIIFDHYPSNAKPLIRSLEKKLINIGRLNNQIEFLTSCKKRKVLPPTFTLKRRYSSDRTEERLLKATEFKLVSIAITRAHQQRKEVNSDMINIAISLYSTLSSTHFHDMWLIIEDASSRQVSKHKSSLTSKLTRLLSKGGLNRHSDHFNSAGIREGTYDTETEVANSSTQPHEPNFINLSSHQFSPNEIAVLDKGSNFALCNPNVVTVDSICKLNFLTKGNDELTCKLAAKIDQVNIKFHKQNPESFKDGATLRNLKHNKELQLSKADKGGKIVALDKTEYTDKLSNIVTSNYHKIQCDPTRKIVTYLRKFLKQDLCWDAKYVEFLIPSAPSTPSIYGQPKVHKEGTPLRPIISQKGSCFSQLGKLLSKQLFDIIERPVSHIKNGQAFVSMVRARPIPNGTAKPRDGMFVSLDVVDMFTSIDPNKALKALSRKLDTIPEVDFRSKLQMTKTQCLNLVRYFLENNYFKFEDSFYTQRKGLAMGSSLSPLLADLVMEEIEINIRTKFHLSIDLWVRYVDDIFLYWIGRQRELDDMLKYANQIDPNIQFTMEKEINQSLNYLDVTVTRNNDGTFRTTLYKKPTSGDGLIHFQSGHPVSLKVNTARQQLRRINNLCSNERDKCLEQSKLRMALQRLKYDKKTIYKIFANPKTNPLPPPNDPKDPTGRLVVLQYQSEVRRCVGSHAQLRNSKIAWGQRYGILNALRHRRMPCKNLKLANAIYAIPCSCGSIYIGETMRQVYVRIKEHQAYFRKHDTNSKIVLHLDEFPDHVMQWDRAIILDIEPNTYFRKLKETAYIELNAQNCISDKSVELNKDWIWILRTHSKKRRFLGMCLEMLPSV